jgi:hypothetical protein
MWEKYELGLTKPTMSFMAKFIVWVLFFEWIKVLFVFGAVGNEAGAIQLINTLVMVSVLWGATATTQHRWPVEAWVYLKNLFGNRPQELNYWIPDGVEDREDRTKWIYRY